MKKALIKTFLGVCGVAGILASCSAQSESIDVYLQKRSGVKREFGSMMGFSEKDTTTFLGKMFPEVKVAPKGMTDVKYYYGHTNFAQALYQSYRQGIISKDECMRYFNAWVTFDTLDYSPDPLQVFVTAAIGMNAENEKLIVFDGNANLDFSDDEAMPYANQYPVPLYHERYMGGKIVPDTTYVYVEDKRGIMLKAAEWASRKITLKGKEYDFYIDNMGMNYDNNTALNFSTPYHTYSYKLGQYAVLDGSFYLIDSLSADGRYMHMTEDPDAGNKEVMQKGFRVCSFTTTDMEGNTIRFPEDFKGKYVLLDFWASTCGPCVYDIKNKYGSIYEKYHDAGFEILGIAEDSSDVIRKFKEKHAMPWITVADGDHENELLKRFNIHSFPTLYLIGPDGRICAEDMEARIKLEELLARYLKDFE